MIGSCKRSCDGRKVEEGEKRDADDTDDWKTEKEQFRLKELDKKYFMHQ